MADKLNETELGYETCSCGYIHVHEAGADWPEESWTVCTECGRNVVDKTKVSEEI